nr:nucleoside diphosphate kinase homolog 5 isoform X3 [Pelodiscus sinensis]|eukprot:XP_025036972.1 nucleoside diphosphate kinase homolog 5 isoform X3 [Pelodiscus sinensis]
MAADESLNKRKLQLSPEQCSNFYAEQYGKMFFPNLTAYMSSGPLVAMVLARHNAIAFWKELIGPSNSIRAKETHPDSLRAIYGTDDLRNAVHGSIKFSSAEREIRFMFPEVIIEPIPVGQAAKDYLNLYVNPTLLAGLTELCKQKPADPLFQICSLPIFLSFFSFHLPCNLLGKSCLDKAFCSYLTLIPSFISLLLHYQFSSPFRVL